MATTNPTPQAPYADPELEYPIIKLSELPDFPDGWTFLNDTTRQARRNRRLRRPQVEEAVEFYTWGIDLEGMTVTIDNGIRCLWKIFYNQARQHWPTSYHDLMDFRNRDAGPRLFSCTINHPQFLPISRYYPHPPSAAAATKLGYTRPTNATHTIPDSYIEQMQYPASGGAVIKDMAEAFHEEAGRLGGISATDPSIRTVVEAVEKAVMRFAQWGLERHHTATPREPRAHLTAVQLEDLTRSVTQVFPATSTVTLSSNPATPDRLIFDPEGTEYPYRGRGPIWYNNSGAVDCAIVAGKLLDAGSTVIDRSSLGWEQLFSNAQRAFIEATDTNWDTCSTESNLAIRDRLWELIAEAAPNVQPGERSSVWSIWNACTSDFAQFAYTVNEETTPCDCEAEPTIQLPASTGTCLMSTLPSNLRNYRPVPMQDIIQRFFVPKTSSDCEVCGAENAVLHHKYVAKLPPRLVVSLDGTEKIHKHTCDIEFEYLDGERVKRTAHYRWLGGIYEDEDQLRLFWTDTERGVSDNGDMMMYDSTMNLGLIVGGIPQTHRDDKVPDVWWKRRAVPLLFYEQIDNPSAAVLDLALHTVFDMVTADRNQQNMMNRVSWSRPKHPTEHQNPWPPVLPTAPAGLVAGDGPPVYPEFAGMQAQSTSSSMGPVAPVAYFADPSQLQLSNSPIPRGQMNPGYAVPVYHAPNQSQVQGTVAEGSENNSGPSARNDFDEFMSQYTLDPRLAEDDTSLQYLFVPSPTLEPPTLPEAGEAAQDTSSDEEMAFASCSLKSASVRTSPVQTGRGGKVVKRSSGKRVRGSTKKVEHPLVKAATMARAKRAQNQK